MDGVAGIDADLRSRRWLYAVPGVVLAVCAVLWLGGFTQAGAALWPLLLALLAALLLLAVVLMLAIAWHHTWHRARHADEALREARSRLQSTQELLDVWQWRTDAGHRLVEIRPPQGAPIGDWRPAAETPLWQWFRVEDEAALRARLASGAPLDDVDGLLPDGAAGGASSRSGRLRARPWLDRLGAFAGHHGVVREMEAAAPAAPALAPPNVESFPEQESFSYTVSHDLRAPIRVVEGFTRIIKEDYGRLLDRVGNDHLDRVLGAAARMNNMIDALLALSKLASQPLVRQPVNLSQLSGYVVDDLRRQWPERAVKVVIEPDMQLSGDPTLLRVVLENLIGNAWKYSAKSAQAQIWFERSPLAADTYTVCDNGAGFDMRFADRLFGVFQRLHSANDFAGTGIGLATVRRIVRRHGGEIWGEAEVNRGARFHFSIPQQSIPQPSVPQTSLAQTSLPQTSRL